MEYRRKFIYPLLFKGIDLNNKRILELASGSGENSKEFLALFPHAEVYGLDISKELCANYEQNVNRPALHADLTIPADALLFSEKFDIAVIIGGLHHCLNGLDSAIFNITKMLKPGGLLLVMEPNAECFLDSLRRFWYKHDKFFAEEESAFVFENLAQKMQSYSLLDVTYFGNIAYFAILNSLILRIPLGIKKFAAKPLFLLERFFNIFKWKRLYPVFIARFQLNQ